MIVSVKTGKVELNKTELGKLDAAAGILALLAKHGGPDLADVCDEALEAIGRVKIEHAASLVAVEAGAVS